MRAPWLVGITAWLLASCGADLPPPEARPLFPELVPEEDCEDGLDNDDDFLVDCEDEACLEALPCLPPACDSPDECQDPACQAAHVCYERSCQDGRDEDEDGLTDCQDLDCAYVPACGEEACRRQRSEDGTFAVGPVREVRSVAEARDPGPSASLLVVDVPPGTPPPPALRAAPASRCLAQSGLLEQALNCQDPDCAGAVGGGAPRGEGEPCLDGSGCRSGRCLSEEETGYPGGMCAALCDPEAPCPEGGVCLDGTCLPACAHTEDCRPGYSCFDRVASGPVCVPDCVSGAECPGTGQCEWFSGRCGWGEGFRDGARCTSGEECAGGHCDPSGYCVSLCSPSRESCPPGEECVALSGSRADPGLCREESGEQAPLPWEEEDLLSELGDPPLSLGVSYPDPQPSDESDPVFSLDYVHKVSLFMTPEEKGRLRLGEREWARARLVYDGHVLEEVGVRLKGGYGSGDELGGKPSFSVKLNEFQRGQGLYGQRKIILNNARQDPSFLSEHMAYWLYAREGIPASRTAFAWVALNGEPYGLYVVVEAKDKRFFAHRGLPKGSLYEGSYGADLDDISSLEEHAVKDPEALGVLSHLLQSTPDEALLERLAPVVRLDAFVTLWAIEALYYHWDGYLYQANNYYLYHDPRDGRFLFLPHGADQLFHDATTRLDAYPMGFLAARLADTGRVKGPFLKEAQRLLGDPSLEDAFRARVDQALRLIESAARADPRAPYSEEERLRASAWVREFVSRRREFLRAMLGL